MKIKKYLGLSLILLFLPLIVEAEANIIPSGCISGSCTLDDFIQLFVNLYTAGLFYVGGVALLFLIIGGFILLVSHGRQDQVDLGKRIITNTVIGIAIVMLSWLIINTIQTKILDVNDPVLILSSHPEDCTAKADGATCAKKTTRDGSYEYVYRCKGEICAFAACNYGVQYNLPGYSLTNTNGQKINMSCKAKSDCDPDGTIKSNECPGGLFCCYPNGFIE